MYCHHLPEVDGQLLFGMESTLLTLVGPPITPPPPAYV